MLGAVQVRPPSGVRLNLRAPGAVSELKTAMGMCPHMLDRLFGDAASGEFDQAFFESDVWDEQAVRFGRLWLDEYRAAFPGAPTVGLLQEPYLFPTATGVVHILGGLLGYGSQPTVDVDFGEFPHLTRFYDELGGNPAQGEVSAPRLEELKLPTPLQIVVGCGVLVVLGAVAYQWVGRGK